MSPLIKLGHLAARSINKNADLVFAMGALIGLGVSIALVAKITPTVEYIIDSANNKIEDIRDEANEQEWTEEEEEEAIKSVQIDMVKDIAYNCLPAIIAIITTCGSILGSVKAGRANNTVLLGMLNASNYAYQELRDHTVNVIGKRKATDIHDEIRRKHLEECPVPQNETIYNTGTGQTLCYIETEPGLPSSGLYFWASPESVHSARNELNDLLLDYGCASFADFLYFLKLKNVDAFGANKKGWNRDRMSGLIRLRESSHIHPQTGHPTLDISFYDMPQFGYD